MPDDSVVNDCWEIKGCTSSICIHTWSQSCPNLMMTTRDSSCRQGNGVLVSPIFVSGWVAHHAIHQGLKHGVQTTEEGENA